MSWPVGFKPYDMDKPAFKIVILHKLYYYKQMYLHIHDTHTQKQYEMTYIVSSGALNSTHSLTKTITQTNILKINACQLLS